jgi:hypothetical protein
MLGAQHIDLPEDYIDSIASVASIEDPDMERRREREALIARIGQYL